jgi:hypothetical protein
MANKLSGTNLASQAVPFTDEDNYPTHAAMYGKGGHHSVDTTNDRNNIPLLRREVGMTCYVLSTDKTYKLINNPAANTTQDTDWEIDVPSTDDILLDDGKTSLSSKISNLDLSAEKYAVLCIKPVEVGPDSTEQIIPFNTNAISLEGNIPVATVLTKDVVVNVELYNGTTWSTLGTLTIPLASTTKSITQTLAPVAITSGNRVRANIISAQDRIESLSILIGMKLTN